MTRAENLKKWAAMIDVQATSGMSTRKWCQENGVGYTLFLYWKKQFAKKNDSAISMHFGNGLKLSVAPGFDEETLRRIVLALRCANPETIDRNMDILQYGLNVAEEPEIIICPANPVKKDCELQRHGSASWQVGT